MTDPKFTENFDDFGRAAVNPDNGMPAATAPSDTPKRGGTLKKKNSIKRKSSVKRSSSRAGSVRSVQLEPHENKNSIFYTPVPTKTNPTEALVTRFTSWRRVLKDFIAYFREVQTQYEARSRGISKVTQTLNQAVQPSDFLTSGGILETNNVLRDFHHEVTANSENAARIETEIIRNLVGLRNDLNHKIKEIKGLSGDFKNNIDKDKEAMKKEVTKLQDELEALERNPAGGKDPYVTRLTVERQLRHYLSEENYLHRAYLNLESSGRELERIVVGEIQKAYNVYVNILAKEGRELIDVSERLTASTLRLPPDYEWNAFVERDPKMVNPQQKIRIFDEIEYPGCHHPAALEVKTGTLERKSKYLKSFTPAWYVLSPTHLHEFKSPDRTRDYQPVMSLYLPDSSLGKHSDPSAVSHKFVVKGKQTGGMHRGHSWVFRAETHEIMMEWYDSIKKLTEISGRERDSFVADVVQRQRAVSSASRKTDHDSSSSDYGLENDEADEVPYSGQVSQAEQQVDEQPLQPPPPIRPEGGRFPSDIDVSRYSTRRASVSDESSNEAVANAAALPGAVGAYGYDQRQQQQGYPDDAYTPQQQQQQGYTDGAYAAQQQQAYDNDRSGGYGQQNTYLMSGATQQPVSQPLQDTNTCAEPPAPENSNYNPPSRDAGNYAPQGGADRTDGDAFIMVAPGANQHHHQEQQEQQMANDSNANRTGDHGSLSTPSRPLPTENLTTYSQQRVPLADTGAGLAAPQSRDGTQNVGIDTGLAGPEKRDNVEHIDPAPAVTGGPVDVTDSNEYGGNTLATGERPESVRNDSRHTTNTISDLHVPGEYPRKV